MSSMQTGKWRTNKSFVEDVRRAYRSTGLIPQLPDGMNYGRNSNPIRALVLAAGDRRHLSIEERFCQLYNVDVDFIDAIADGIREQDSLYENTQGYRMGRAVRRELNWD